MKRKIDFDREGLTLVRKKAAADSRRKYEETGKVDFVPAYSEVDQSAVNYGPAGSYDY